MTTFQDLKLNKEILTALSLLKFKEPLEVQTEIIPLVQQGKNIVFTSQTGSGKTLAYSLGIIGKLDRKRDVQMIVLVPTRELCIQVGKELKKICDILGLNVGMLYGGRDIKGDFKTVMKKNQILVGTPGRLTQHINEKKIVVGEVKFIVFDESDQMFDNGFYEDCTYIKKRISKNAQIILSSATISTKVETFMSEVIGKFEFRKLGFHVPKGITQEKIYCKIKEKDELLLKLLAEKKINKAIIFCNTKIRTTEISEFLNKNGYEARALNSDFEQKDRDNNLNVFKEHKKIILVATDVAARGLHIDKVDLVINYDIPKRTEFYIHRIGRTGRNEKTGYALSMICPEDKDRFNDIEFDYEINPIELDRKKYF
jgi:superfamily II DNA/RNA helicase